MQRNSCEKQYPALKKISLMTYNAGKKSYTIICRRKNISNSRSLGKIITLTKSPVPPPHKRPMVMSTIKGVGEETDFTP